MVYLILSERITVQVLKITWYKKICSSRGIKHILSPVRDRRGNGFLERSIHTIKQKLGAAKLDPNFKNFKETIQQIIEDIRRSNHSVLKKSLFELHFGRKPNTEWSQAFHNVVNLILQPKDWSGTFQRRTRLPPRIIAWIVQKLILEAVQVLRLLPLQTVVFAGWKCGGQ